MVIYIYLYIHTPAQVGHLFPCTAETPNLKDLVTSVLMTDSADGTAVADADDVTNPITAGIYEQNRHRFSSYFSVLCMQMMH